jgi:hypothetical protein
MNNFGDHNLDKGLQRDTDNLIDQNLLSSSSTKESGEVNVKLSSNFQAYMNSVKIFLGNVYLTIPNVFSHVGWLGGITLYSLVALLNTYTMTSILEVAKIYSDKKDEMG